MKTAKNKPSVFFYVQHLLGIGHQMRASQLARAMTLAGLDVHYVSGGFNDMALDLGTATFHQLPPIRTGDSGFSTLIGENGQVVDDTYWQERQIRLQQIKAEINPSAYLIEGFPFARRKFSKEIIPLLEYAKVNGCPVFCSVRDILVPPSTEKKAQAAIDQVNGFFTKILVHGDENFISLTHSLPEARKISDKLYYTGYVAPKSIADNRPNDGEILVSAGGGAVGQALLLNTLEVAEKSEHKWHFLMGPNLPTACRKKLQAHQGENIVVEDARPDFRELLAKSRLSISQAGYNTVMDLMATKTPAVLVPFGTGRESEQPTRAQLLQNHGLVSVICEDNLSPKTLTAAIKQALTLPKLENIPFKTDGAAVSAQFIKKSIVERVK